MKKIESYLTALILTVVMLSGNLFSQQITISKSDPVEFTLVNDPQYYNFDQNGNSIFITEKYESAVTKFFQTSFDASGKLLVSTKLEIPVGDMKNAFDLDDIIIHGGKQYALIRNLNNVSGLNTYSAREITNGTISTSETIIANFPYEKIMKSGSTNVVVSPDQKKLLAMSWLPEEKDVLPKLTLTVFNENLVKERDVTLDYSGDMKRASFQAVIGNDGSVYMVKKVMNKIGETELSVCYLKSDNTLAEYKFTLADPYYVTSYVFTVNDNNELVVSGVYYKRETVSTGDPKTFGVFYYTMKNKTENVFQSFALDTPVENLVARKILFTQSTAFLVTEQYKSVADPVPAGTTTVTYNYTITHKSNFVIGMDLTGVKKFQIELQKDFSTRNADHQNHAAAFICNGKLTMIYNDDYKKYNPDGYGGQIPVLVQITDDGLSSSPLVFKDNLSIGKTLFPCFAVQHDDTKISMLAGDGSKAILVTINIAD